MYKELSVKKWYMRTKRATNDNIGTILCSKIIVVRKVVWNSWIILWGRECHVENDMTEPVDTMLPHTLWCAA